MGSDREVKSDFQLLAGTNRDLAQRVREGSFRDDLLARIELWTFKLPGLRERPEDVEPNLDFELEQATRTLGMRVTMNREARQRFVAFATAPEAVWSGNFRDFNAAVTRMATLSTGGRIDVATVDDELARLRARWQLAAPREAASDTARAAPDEALLREALGEEGAAALDRFDRAQLADVIRVCRATPTLSAAGRALFAVSRAGRTSVNDADRLRKYLARHGLSWELLHPTA
jgi:transcriptional regulatory protein RtcR